MKNIARTPYTLPSVLAFLCLCLVSLMYVQVVYASEDNPYVDAVLADKPVGYWRFEEASNASVAVNLADKSDATQGSYNMVTLGIPSATKALGNAAAFHGADADSYIDLGSPESLMIRGDLTIEWWQYVTNSNVEDQAIICWAKPGDSASDNVLYEVVLRYDEKQKEQKYPRPQIVLGHEYGQGTNVRMPSQATVHFNRWYHIAVVRDADARTVQYYINGFPSGEPISYATNNNNPTGGESAGVTIGRLGQFDSRYFQGYLDEVAVYNHTLTADRILKHYRTALKGADMKERSIVVAHRGNNRFAPENTIVSYKQAIEAKAPMVEMDLQYSKDGVIILMHDKTLDRTTDGTGEVKAKTLDELKTLDAGTWKGTQYTGEPVPTFAEVAKVCKGQTIIMLDLKTLVKGDDIAKALSEADFPEDQVVVAPWQIEHATSIKPYLPDANMILLHSQLPEEYTGDDVFFDNMKQLGFSGFSLNWTHLTESFVRAARQNGMKVYTWTINDPVDISGAVLMKVDGIITDDPKATAVYINDVIR